MAREEFIYGSKQRKEAALKALARLYSAPSLTYNQRQLFKGITNSQVVLVGALRRLEMAGFVEFHREATEKFPVLTTTGKTFVEEEKDKAFKEYNIDVLGPYTPAQEPDEKPEEEYSWVDQEIEVVGDTQVDFDPVQHEEKESIRQALKDAGLIAKKGLKKSKIVYRELPRNFEVV